MDKKFEVRGPEDEGTRKTIIHFLILAVLFLFISVAFAEAGNQLLSAVCMALCFVTYAIKEIVASKMVFWPIVTFLLCAVFVWCTYMTGNPSLSEQEIEDVAAVASIARGACWIIWISISAYFIKKGYLDEDEDG